MTNRIDFLVERFERIAEDWSDLGDQEDRDAIAAMLDVAKYLILFRDTLLSIARNQNGIASHQAQDALKETGHCYHFNQIYKAGPGPNESEGTWVCEDCKTSDAEHLVPYQ